MNFDQLSKTLPLDERHQINHFISLYDKMEGHKIFVCYIAFFPYYTSHLLYKVLEKFNNKGKIDPIAISDVLNASFSTKVSEGVYKMPYILRQQLIGLLIDEFGIEWLNELAKFTQNYLKNFEDKIILPYLKNNLGWVAMAQLNPTETSKQLANKLENSFKNNLRTERKHLIDFLSKGMTYITLDFINLHDYACQYFEAMECGLSISTTETIQICGANLPAISR